MKKSKKQAIIFGISGFSEVVDFYLTHDSEYEVVGFTASADTLSSDMKFRGKNICAFEELENIYNPADVELFIAVGYRKMNRIREDLMKQSKAKGYRLLTYVCSKASHLGNESDEGCHVGENTFIFEDNTLQPFSSIGDGTILWSGNHIGHHSLIGNCCFISSHVVVSGHCKIGDRCFIGVNSTIADSVSIGNDNLIGARCLIEKNTMAGEVYLDNRTSLFKRSSDKFFK